MVIKEFFFLQENQFEIDFTIPTFALVYDKFIINYYHNTLISYDTNNLL